MPETEPSVPVEEPAVESAAPPKRDPLRNLIYNSIVLGSVLALLAIGGGTYWVFSADARLERRATDALLVLAELQERMVYPEGTQLLILEDGYVKLRYVTQPSMWNMRPTGNENFPFEATIVTPYERFASLVHDTQEDALADNRMYRLPDEDFYRDAERATEVARQNFYYTPKLEATLIYDRRRSKWFEHTRGAPLPDAPHQSAATR